MGAAPTVHGGFLESNFGRLARTSRKYEAGIARAVAGLEGGARLERVFRFIVEFQHAYPLRRLVDVEPEHVVQQTTRVLPILRARLLPHFPSSERLTIASAVTRIALSHALIPERHPESSYAELRHAAGLDAHKKKRSRHRRLQPVRHLGPERRRPNR